MPGREPKKEVKIPTKITRDVEKQLKDLGLSQEEIDTLTPQGVWDAINRKRQEKKLETKTFSTDFIKTQIASLLLGDKKVIRKIISINPKGNGGEITLIIRAEARTLQGNINETINIRITLENQEDTIKLKSCKVDASLTELEELLESILAPKLKKISEILKDSIEKKENKKVKEMEIVKRELKVTFSEPNVPEKPTTVSETKKLARGDKVTFEGDDSEVVENGWEVESRETNDKDIRLKRKNKKTGKYLYTIVPEKKLSIRQALTPTPEAKSNVVATPPGTPEEKIIEEEIIPNAPRGEVTDFVDEPDLISLLPAEGIPVPEAETPAFAAFKALSPEKQEQFIIESGQESREKNNERMKVELKSVKSFKDLYDKIQEEKLRIIDSDGRALPPFELIDTIEKFRTGKTEAFSVTRTLGLRDLVKNLKKAEAKVATTIPETPEITPKAEAPAAQEKKPVFAYDLSKLSEQTRKAIMDEWEKAKKWTSKDKDVREYKNNFINELTHNPVSRFETILNRQKEDLESLKKKGVAPDKIKKQEDIIKATEEIIADLEAEAEKEILNNLEETIAATAKRLAEIDKELAEIKANEKGTNLETPKTQADIDEKSSALKIELENIREAKKNIDEKISARESELISIYDKIRAKEQERSGAGFLQRSKKKKLKKEIAELKTLSSDKDTELAALRSKRDETYKAELDIIHELGKLGGAK